MEPTVDYIFVWVEGGFEIAERRANDVNLDTADLLVEVLRRHVRIPTPENVVVGLAVVPKEERPEDNLEFRDFAVLSSHGDVPPVEELQRLVRTFLAVHRQAQ